MVSKSDRDPALERRAKAVFDRSTAGLSAEIRSRLTQARYAALEQLDGEGRSTSTSYSRHWLPAAGVAAAAVVGVVVWVSRPVPQDAPLVAIEDLELILAEEGLELYEDLEFYSWLGNQPELEGGPAGTDIG